MDSLASVVASPSTASFSTKIEHTPTAAVISLDDETKARLSRDLRAVSSPYEKLDEVILQIEPLFAALPTYVRRAIRRFATEPGFEGALLIKNLPQDEALPETPPRGKRPVGKVTFVSEAVILGIGQLVGHVFGYTGEKEGEMVHQIAPVRGREKAASNEGSGADFGPHTECGGLPIIPTYLSLYCLRADSANTAATFLVHARDVVERLDPATIEALQKPHFQMRVPESFGGIDVWSEAKPILRGGLDLPEIWYNRDAMRATTPEAEPALEALSRLTADPSIQHGIVLQPGELVLLDNRKTTHGRQPFTPRYDGTDRWLHRIYLRRDLWEGRTFAKGPRLF
jgi:L-asparagine oxygenase